MKNLKVYSIIENKLYQRGEFIKYPIDYKLNQLNRLNIRIVVNMIGNFDSELNKYINCIHIPIPDNKVMNGETLILRAKYISKFINENDCAALVHCHAGRNRSALMSALVCMDYLGITGVQAVELLRIKRPNALANDNFVKFLESKEVL